MPSPTIASQALARARERGLVRPRDLRDLAPNPSAHLRSLAERGRLIRLARGLYAPPELEPTELHSLAEAAKLVPGGVVCLLSALRVHELGTQSPAKIWMAVERWKPSRPAGPDGAPPIRFVQFTGSAFEHGVSRREVEGVEVRVYSPAKTIADCFRFRNKIGLDAAVEALRDGAERRVCSVSEIKRAAQACGVSRVMAPYLEML
jgi:predicted transcriptional regulator of viral defense system